MSNQDLNMSKSEPVQSEQRHGRKCEGIGDYIAIAFSGPVVRRALFFMFVVGLILASINHGDCAIQGHFETRCAILSLMTMMVPYVVSTVSSVLAIVQQNKECNKKM